jgi:hypothetical protein
MNVPALKTKLPDSIRITLSDKYGSSRFVTSSHPVFDGNEIIIDFDDEAITMTNPTIDHRGEARPVSKANQFARKIYVGYLIVDTGFYRIDPDESTEDKIVVYIEDKIEEDETENNI